LVALELGNFLSIIDFTLHACLYLFELAFRIVTVREGDDTHAKLCHFVEFLHDLLSFVLLNVLFLRVNAFTIALGAVCDDYFGGTLDINADCVVIFWVSNCNN